MMSNDDLLRGRAPIIAVTPRGSSDQVEEGSVTVARRAYLDAIVAAGGLPIVLPLISNLDAVTAILERCDGVLVPGGEDIAPEHYGESPHPLLGTVDRARDDVELAVVRAAWRKKLPILGICRGHQLVNVALGGALYQDINQQRPEQPPHPQGKWLVLVHDLALISGCRLASILAATTISVNSSHHQAVRRVGAGLTAVGTTPDGLIEATESSDQSRWVVTVQCHPETLWQSVDKRWKGLFEAFVNQARVKYHTGLATSAAV